MTVPGGTATSERGTTAERLAAIRRATYRAAGHPLFWIGVVLAQVATLGLYFQAADSRVTSLRHVLYPFVWIDLGLWAAIRVPSPAAPRRRRWLAGGAAGIYLLVLGWFAGLLGAGGEPLVQSGSIAVAGGPPGWGPRLTVVTGLGYLHLVPFQVDGYLALAYLVFVALLDAGGVLGGTVGALACASCSFPLLASLLGPGTAVGAIAAAGLSLDLATAAFVLAVGLLVWRPGT